jgi:hypothetical protein
LAGLPSTGDADFRAEIGRGSTPRNGAGSIATDAAARPRPARIWVSRPPKEWPMIAGFWASPRMIVSKWSATWLMDLCANTSGWAFASCTVSGSSGQPGVKATYPLSSNSAAQRSQLLGSSHRPWTNTTGGRPVALARSHCSSSCSVIILVLGGALDPSLVMRLLLSGKRADHRTPIQ